MLRRSLLIFILFICSNPNSFCNEYEIIDFSSTTFNDSICREYWLENNQAWIEVDTTNYWSPIIFIPGIIFDFSSFSKRVEFYYAHFESELSFNSAEFKSDAVFNDVIFNSLISFGGADFRSFASFYGTMFKDTANFDGSIFNALTNFYETDFGTSASFKHATFKDDVNFAHANFNSAVVDFENATFDSTAFFWHTTFGPMVIFREASFLKNAEFYGAKLPDTLDLRSVTQIKGKLDFTYSLPPRLSKKCLIALAGADISKIKLRMDLFELWFPDSSFIVQDGFIVQAGKKDTVIAADTTILNDSSLVITADTLIGIWDKEIFSHDHKIAVYEQLLEKLASDGMMESFKILDIDYRKFKAKHSGGFSWYFLDTFQDWWWNYGYTKERVFIWAIGFWLLFSFINLFFYHKLIDGVYSIGFLGAHKYQASKGIKKLIFYNLYVITYTAQIFFGLKMNMDNFKTGVIKEHPFLFSYLMIVYIVGLICLGFIVNIIFTR
ncbi:MAG: hypothetical protein GY839_04575 [candidate division Zixibacteria bacterium]|nr:hypothetical protein [candidate division Zixibacteria bacterium]